MEGFWAYGDLAQTIAFPFEVIGCALVAWEIFTPRVADKIETWIDWFSDGERWVDFSSNILTGLHLIWIFMIFFSLFGMMILLPAMMLEGSYKEGSYANVFYVFVGGVLVFLWMTRFRCSSSFP